MKAEPAEPTDDRTASEQWKQGLPRHLLRSLTIEVVDDGPTRVIVAPTGQLQRLDLPLTGLPPKCTIEITAGRVQSLKLQGCRRDLAIKVTGDTSCGLVQFDQPLGTLHLDCPANQPVKGRSERLVLSGRGEHHSPHISGVSERPVLDGGAVNGDFDRLTVTTRGGKISRGRIGELFFERTADAGTEGNEEADAGVVVFKATAGPSVSFGRLVVPAPDICELAEQDTTVDVLGGQIKTDQKLTVKAIAEGGAHVNGTGTVTIPDHHVVTGLSLDGPELNVRRHAAILDLVGQLRVVRAVDATIVGRSGEPCRFRGITGDADPANLEGATLRGLTIDDTAEGRRHLRQLERAAVVDPELSDLRIRSYGFNWRCPLPHGIDWHRPRDRPTVRRPWTRERRTDENRRDVHDAAYFAQELAGLVEAKSGQGSTRTRAAWAAYRGRELVASTRTERSLLRVFRLVGYGQIAGPALLTWAFAVVVGAIAFSCLTDSSYWDALWQLASTPLVVLRLVGTPDLPDASGATDAAAAFVRAVAMVPFVFAGIATARYLRADWPFKT